MMKNLLSLLLLFVCASIHAQYDSKKDPKQGDYFRDPKLDKFVGVWVNDHAADNSLFSLKLEKKKVQVKAKVSFYQDQIAGTVTYTPKNSEPIIIPVKAIATDANRLFLVYTDIKKSKTVEVEILYVPNGIQWRIVEAKEKHTVNTKPIPGHTLPEKLHLQKN